MNPSYYKAFFHSLTPDQKIRLKVNLYWQAFAANVEDKYNMMQLICMWFHQQLYIGSNAWRANIERYESENRYRK